MKRSIFLQTTFSNAFSRNKIALQLFKFHRFWESNWQQISRDSCNGIVFLAVKLGFHYGVWWMSVNQGTILRIPLSFLFTSPIHYHSIMDHYPSINNPSRNDTDCYRTGHDEHIAWEPFRNSGISVENTPARYLRRTVRAPFTNMV